MTVKETAHAYKLQQWTGLICDCKASGKTVTAWCAEQNINTKTYYYWQRRVREAACEQLAVQEAPSLPMVPIGDVPEFAEYRQPNLKEAGSAITLHISGAIVEIHNDADADVIASTLNALKNIC